MINISIIAAVADNRVIGNGRELPWHLPADLKYFRDVTMGKPVIMGRLTFDSIGSPLAGRKNIVVTRNPDFRVNGATSVVSVPEALSLGLREAEIAGVDEICVVGGAQIYEASLSHCTRMFITEVHLSAEGAILVPVVDWGVWKEVSRQFHRPSNGQPAYSFVNYEAKFSSQKVDNG